MSKLFLLIYAVVFNRAVRLVIFCQGFSSPKACLWIFITHHNPGITDMTNVQFSPPYKRYARCGSRR
jgi:hypothetical protein